MGIDRLFVFNNFSPVLWLILQGVKGAAGALEKSKAAAGGRVSSVLLPMPAATLQSRLFTQQDFAKGHALQQATQAPVRSPQRHPSLATLEELSE